ncbi:receptor-like protein EIX2 [Cannabis sativa]|uniref:Leucine-rich repeat-containing N-terminal plant-type domain-containing protein n=2 Tax=Cannabis sativa TaxID=3483 RepID=A0A7J6EIK1_CANSA|nr:receptor-like protein EIX2 [Cannabis sativa]KAF4357549.1 hypothetical protein G4B88_026928 [Cannabis sativa]
MVVLVLVLMLATTMCHHVWSSNISGQCIESERQALLTFKNGLVDKGNKLSSWTNTRPDCCDWNGIRCDNLTHHIIELSLSYLNGEIGSSLVELKQLRHLDLSGSYDGHLEAHNLKWLSSLPFLKDVGLGDIDLSKATDWFQSIKTAHSLTSLYLESCQLPQVDMLSLSNKNSSNSLTYLSLIFNTIHPTTFPWMLNLSTNLVELGIFDTYNIRGPLPNSFENMRNLEKIYFNENGFEGGIPKSLGNLCTLKELSLCGNNFNTTTLHDILELLCTKDSLQVLDLRSNQLSGSIPTLSNMPYLREFDVSGNSLSGVISEVHFQNLSKLEVLGLSSNSLALKFKSNWVPPFQLTSIHLSFCKLGPKFPSWLKTQVKIRDIRLSHNEINDTIPIWFNNFISKMEYVDLSHNQFHGSFSLYNVTSIMSYVDLSYNQFHGSFSLYDVAFPIYQLDLSSNQFSGSISLYNFTSEMRNLNLSFNQFSGPIPSSLSSHEMYLQNNKLTSLTSFMCKPFLVSSPHKIYVLDLSNNMLSGSLPECFGNFSNLAFLNLGNNNLSGLIPKSMGSLQEIRVLQLRHNNFSGNLPSLQKCEQLQVFDVGDNSLEGKIPLWIGQNLKNLIFLSLKSNKFNNCMPSNLCNLHAIEMLDLSTNSIFGNIPPCLEKFTSMVEKRDHHQLQTGSSKFRVDVPVDENGLRPMELESLVIMWKGVYYENQKIFESLRLIDLSSNQLSGEIPETLTHLVQLNQLNLSWNNLDGGIPKEIGKLSNLQSLDLSNNNLSGQIPSSLATISFLSFLKLSNNNLFGKIPTGTQLQSFEASSYTGNLGLCGPPLTNSSCSNGTNNGSINVVEDGDKWLDMKQFHMGIGVGFIVGFVGVCVNIFLLTSWRPVYFRFLNAMGDWLYVRISIKMAKFKRMFSSNT